MAHIFFEKLEERRSTQSFFPSPGTLGSYTSWSAPVAEYAVSVPTYGGYSPYNPISNPAYVYGISIPGGNYPVSNAFPFYGGNIGYMPWGGSSWGLFGSMYPYGGYSPFSPLGGGSFWGFGGMFSPIFGLFGGLFGMNPYSPWGNNPNYNVLYGVQPVYGVQIPSNFGLF